MFGDEVEEGFAEAFGHIFGLANDPVGAVILLYIRLVGLFLGFLMSFSAFRLFRAHKYLLIQV